ncbi:MAG: hypothetical protein ACR2NN_25745 [Bryobacteraceae bacterium]
MGKMGRSNLSYAMKQENLVPAAMCDVYQRNLDWAVQISKDRAKPCRDFREEAGAPRGDLCSYRLRLPRRATPVYDDREA